MPRLPDSERKTERIDIRISPDDKKSLDELMSYEGYTNVSEFHRSLISKRLREVRMEIGRRQGMPNRLPKQPPINRNY
jgi:Arc/MetJ-type ribon-helix-helix transcriptional regulator